MEIFAPVVSIASTKRRRFLWAAWWTAPPERAPFRKPDASQGGARTREAARRQAEAAAGRALVEVDGTWARAWGRVLMGEAPFAEKVDRTEGGAAEEPMVRPARERAKGSIWEILGVGAGATVEEIKSAFRKRALATHPDHGGDAEAFREVRRASDEALARRAKGIRRPKRK